MSKTNSAPTHGWVISSTINKWLALAFIIFMLVLFIATWTIRYSINKDCQIPYKRNIKILGYWIHVRAGSNDMECPQQ